MIAAFYPMYGTRSAKWSGMSRAGRRSRFVTRASLTSSTPPASPAGGPRKMGAETAAIICSYPCPRTDEPTLNPG